MDNINKGIVNTGTIGGNASVNVTEVHERLSAETPAITAVNVFISYRREDTAAYAGRIRDRLATLLGEAHVFMDVDTIDPGKDFRAAIDAAIKLSQYALVVIGRRWTSLTDSSGQPRIFVHGDMVRHEVRSALDRGVTVVPVLVGGASMPTANALPPDIAQLTALNALALRDNSFHEDLNRLIETFSD